MTLHHLFRSTLLALALMGAATASSISYHGVFTQDDDIVLVHFAVPATGDITIFSLSYAGGTSADGLTIPAGGFDPMLSLFDSTGLLIGFNDDGGGSVPADPFTGNHWDAFLFMPSLAPDIYTLAITEADNGPLGPTLADGFLEAGNGNFAGEFIDLSGSQRQPDWSVDVIGDVSAPVPEPSAFALLAAATGLIAVGKVGRRRRR